jgi:hypothetical protein
MHDDDEPFEHQNGWHGRERREQCQYRRATA